MDVTTNYIFDNDEVQKERERETDGMGKQKLIQPGIGAN